MVLSGKDFAPWSAPSNQTAKAPLTDLAECQSFDEKCKHNHYAEPEVDSQKVAPLEGSPVERLLGYRWDPKARRFAQIPFQVDEVFTRYLDNSASGFSVYSGQDRHSSYAFDREGFRYTQSDPTEPVPCAAGLRARARPGPGARRRRRARLHGERRRPRGAGRRHAAQGNRGGAPGSAERPDRRGGEPASCM